MKKYLFIVSFILFINLLSFSQQPVYEKITTEEGLPSNEIYSILQDNAGMIWIGCDAGLFKYDGIRFISFKSSKQKSKSLTGLAQSNSGRIYAYAFNGQLFFYENDSLYELKHTLGKISNITCDFDNNLIVTHTNGLSVFNENKNSWRHYNDFNNDKSQDDITFTHSIKIGKNGNSYFIAPHAVFQLSGDKLTPFLFDFSALNPSGEYILIPTEKSVWLFGKVNNQVYCLDENKFKECNSSKLKEELKNRKVTNIEYFNDDNIWICTYSGVIVYNVKKDTCFVLYPNYAVSDCLIDREGNYWITTLQNGLIKIPDLNFVAWNADNKTIEHDNIYRITNDNEKIYFATVDGYVGIKNKNSITQFQSDIHGDIQQLTYDSIEKKTYYTINNTLYYYTENSKGKIENLFPPVKSFCHIKNGYVLATSRGTYYYESLNDKKAKFEITGSWSRTVQYNQQTEDLWIATNNGLLLVKLSINNFKTQKTYFEGTQIVSVFLKNDELYALTFDGKIYGVNSAGVITKKANLPENVQAQQFVVYEHNIYVATNKGLWIFGLKDNSWKNLNKTGGLSSDNIQNVLIQNQFIWLATGKGLQRIPIEFSIEKPHSKIYLKKLRVNNSIVPTHEKLSITYNQSIAFELEASAYSSNNKFRYAYRINNDTNWVVFPSNIEQIEIPKLPTGDNIIELKLIDYLGRDSENKVFISCYVNPPFWQKWWFNLLLVVLVIIISIVAFQKRLSIIRKKQLKEIERLKLESELRLSQQSALKAQMNPHFIFNVLNSIKGYIYENDKKNAALYLTSFSDLVRKVLQQSSVAEIKLEEELEILKLYIELESMLLHDNFEYSIIVDDAIDVSNIKIPGLIIQPFVENAFKHGLRHKEGIKKLTLGFTLNEQNSELQITISDNGIGREASAKLNSETTSNHQSFATEATARRIELLNYDKKNSVAINIIDYEDNQKKAIGTTVIITILLND